MSHRFFTYDERPELRSQAGWDVALRSTHGSTVARGYARTVAEPSIRLESGLHAVIRADRFVPGSYELHYGVYNRDPAMPGNSRADLGCFVVTAAVP